MTDGMRQASTLHAPHFHQMLQDAPGGDSAAFAAPRTTASRPLSDATEMYDTDFEDDAEEYQDNSPRASIKSVCLCAVTSEHVQASLTVVQVGQNSLSTMSSYDEAVTPISNHFAAFDFQLREKPVEGPRGPHLFRASHVSSTSLDFHLSMSPMTPKAPPSSRPDTAFRVYPSPLPVAEYGPVTTTATMTLEQPEGIRNPYDLPADVRQWSPQEVAMWMYGAGFEEAIVERFQSNDISGAILVDLKLEDLKELDIQSFGKRHRLWSEIQRLRGSPANSPVDGSSPSSSDGGDPSFRSSPDGCLPPGGPSATEPRWPVPRKNSRRGRVPADTVISPAESVSIVGIEQLIPKPHKCSKGENCSKYRRQQRQLALLAQDHPISPERGGQIIITGDPGNATTADSILRPVSEAVPSVVASSDVLGPGQMPAIQLHEEHLRIIGLRDPQENVKQFLDFQHVQPATSPPEMPSSPAPYEMFPPLQSPVRPVAHENLQTLPKLTIPLTRAATVSPSAGVGMSSSRIDRFGTPCSAMDVPVTAVPLGPVSRDASQSVPPDMRYRRGSAGGPPLASSSSSMGGGPRRESWQPAMGMVRVDEDAALEAVEGPEEPMRHTKDVNHAGWMKKRKTKFLRHEWHEHHFTLKGTSLAMRDDPRSSKVLEDIDVDDYAVACSSLASNNKLSAAFKAMKISTGGGGSSSKRDLDNSTAFAFQLVPAADKKTASGGDHASARSAAVLSAATGKTHHFAVKSRDERIDWMRELMLAKALKQKGEGYQVSVNGNMI